MKIAILAHSTNPRGGVVHALELGDALARLGYDAVVHAPDAGGGGFFRDTVCETAPIPASPVGMDIAEMADIRIADYLRHFENPAHRDFDVFHAQDSISANALATLKQRGLIARFARTVHHLDGFDDPRLTALQTRAVVAADRHFVVSRIWRDELNKQFAIRAEIVGNGVDLARYTPMPSGRDDALRRKLGLGAGPVFLSVGGVEERKNTIRILEAFTRFHAQNPAAQLVIAGGVSLLDHRSYRMRFDAMLEAGGLPPSAVVRAGRIAQDDMPALYRLADALVFPSVKEGFGLVVIEAMASGVPVIASAIAPFIEHLGEDDVVWCDPQDTTSIAGAMAAVLDEKRRDDLISRGNEVAWRHDWLRTARAHLDVYESLREPQHA